MTAIEAKTTHKSARRLNALKANSLAAIVMLVLEFGLGVGVNLYAKIPSADVGKGLLPAFGKAVTAGPIVLTLHALLGSLLLITGISAVVRASLLRSRVLLALASVAFVAIVVAWQSGARFVGNEVNAASMAMAIATGVTILCYATILFVVAPSATAETTPQ